MLTKGLLKKKPRFCHQPPFFGFVGSSSPSVDALTDVHDRLGGHVRLAIGTGRLCLLGSFRLGFRFHFRCYRCRDLFCCRCGGGASTWTSDFASDFASDLATGSAAITGSSTGDAATLALRLRRGLG